MISTMAPNVHSVGAPGRRTVHSMCGMCAVRGSMEVTVEDSRVTWLQGNPHDKAIGASRCAKGSAGLAFEYDDQRPQTPSSARALAAAASGGALLAWTRVACPARGQVPVSGRSSSSRAASMSCSSLW